MPIINLTTELPGQVGVRPRRCKLVTTDDLATVTAAGYLNSNKISPQVVYSNDFFDVCYSAESANGPGTDGEFTVTITDGIPTLVPFIDPNSVDLPTVNNHVVAFDGTGGKLKGAGFASSAVVLNTNVAAGQTVQTATASATPGTLVAFKSTLSETAAVLTSGDISSFNGAITMVGASGGYASGLIGSVSVTGALTSSAVISGVRAELALAAGTLSGATTSPVISQYLNMDAGTFSNSSLFAGNNLTSGILGSVFNIATGATVLMKLDDNNATVGATYIATPTGAVASGNLRTIAISLNGVVYQILAAVAYGT